MIKKFKKISKGKGYIIELLYLFDDFMSKEYRIMVLEEYVHICSKNTAEISDMAGSSEYVEEEWCLYWFCKNEWHSRSIHILKLFIKLAKDRGILYFTSPWFQKSTVKDKIIEDSLQDNQVKSNEEASIRNGDVFRKILK